MRNYTHSLTLMAAVSVGGLALFLVGFFVALAVRSALADPGGPVPNPGHAWVELQDHGVSGTDYWLGTTDNNALELWVNNARALRLEPNVDSPNVIGGYSGNAVTAGVCAAAIGGGGSSGSTNRVTDDYGSVGGGKGNRAGDDAGDTYDRPFATVGGGGGNTASGPSSTVGGGNTNTAGGLNATVGGGANNIASGPEAAVGGGNGNTASGLSKATVAGGGSNTASGDSATVGGGAGNTASNQSATVGGGASNTASGDQASVGGGGGNTANGVSSTVGGGDANTDGGGTNATVGGGHGNIASGSDATVGGGNSNTASGYATTVGGGLNNEASADQATVAGGSDNTASNNWDTVGGGESNTASGWNSTVGGGYQNTTSGLNATVPGGASNTAQGAWSFAAGRRAKANNQGCFVWGDITDADVACNNDNRFIARASGGVYLYTSGDLSTGAYLAAGSGSWSDLSDRNLKDNFSPVDGQDVLARLAEIPIATWNYKAQDDSIRHMGPAAQDFSAAFGLGESDTGISTVDADGVALAAIQGLYSLAQEQDVRIQTLEARIAALESGIARSGASGGLLSGLTPGWLLLCGLLLVGLVVVQRRRAGGRP